MAVIFTLYKSLGKNAMLSTSLAQVFCPAPTVHSRPVLRHSRGIAPFTKHSETVNGAPAAIGTCAARWLAVALRSLRAALMLSPQGEL